MNKFSWLFLGLTLLVPVFAFSFPWENTLSSIPTDSIKKGIKDKVSAAIPKKSDQISPENNFQQGKPGQRYKSLSAGTYLYAIAPKSALRRQPTINSEIIKFLNLDTKLIFMERHVSWFKVKVAKTGQVGYIHQYMVK